MNDVQKGIFHDINQMKEKLHIQECEKQGERREYIRETQVLMYHPSLLDRLLKLFTY